MEELNDQPDNVIETLYNDCLREADFKAELRRIKKEQKRQGI
jgi:hypothetical protein